MFVLLFSHIAVHAQTENKILNTYWGNVDALLDAQAGQIFSLIDKTLVENPPIITESLVRQLALYNLDALLHDVRYDNSEPLFWFVSKRMERVIEDLSKPIKTGMEIYKLYNDGYIIRTKSVTIGFDIVRGRYGQRPYIPDSLMQCLVKKCDVLFISHVHTDHADLDVAKMFIHSGKKVIVPTGLWNNVDSSILHLRNEKQINEQIKIRQSTLKVQIFPGHQEDVLNNIYVVTTPENICVAHTGDQYNKFDMPWIIKIKESTSVDVLLIDCWSMKIKETIDGFNPKLVITGHEDEMGHSVDHREPYWLTYQKMKDIELPHLIMTWGEFYHYFK